MSISFFWIGMPHFMHFIAECNGLLRNGEGLGDIIQLRRNLSLFTSDSLATMFIHSQKRCTFRLSQTRFCVCVCQLLFYMRGLLSSNEKKLDASASHFDRIRVENVVGRGIAHFKKQSNCLMLSLIGTKAGHFLVDWQITDRNGGEKGGRILFYESI